MRLHKDILTALRRIAAERTIETGERMSVSAAITAMVEQHSGAAHEPPSPAAHAALPAQAGEDRAA